MQGGQASHPACSRAPPTTQRHAPASDVPTNRLQLVRLFFEVLEDVLLVRGGLIETPELSAVFREHPQFNDLGFHGSGFRKIVEQSNGRFALALTPALREALTLSPTRIHALRGENDSSVQSAPVGNNECQQEITLSRARKTPQRRSADVVQDALDWEGGEVVTDDLLKIIQLWQPTCMQSVEQDIRTAGGMQNFASEHPHRFTLCGRPGTSTQVIQFSPQYAAGKAIRILAGLLKARSGTIQAAQVAQKLHGIECKAFDFHLRRVGGIRRFVAQHARQFRWIPATFHTAASIALVDERELPYFSRHPQQSEHAAFDTMGDFLLWHGGYVPACQVLPLLRQWGTPAAEHLRLSICARGLKAFTAQRADRFTWFVDGVAGADAILLRYHCHERAAQCLNRRSL